ncbi:hypothetical protein BU23DRAFT_589235 [Bimuria novae-zelandiae CBS 107.79]|uniref:Nucleoside-diphosphate-sugar epimerase n=1 Tax=Bimuria novae-zelandiae CBS 107.79 TaxID=1447943 RepID=A0A6A5VA33_9PLEO|nr:hypothetical protein BU23DRAFT_589235 [Bimuria novae-zelandiae CBS 107.79]
MVHLILTGATGLIGSGVLQQMLASDAITRISILSRQPVKMTEGHEDKVRVIICKDFKNYDQALLDELEDAQGCVWALGVSQNAVDKAKYFEITHDYPLDAAKAFSTLHPSSPFTFDFVSDEGATQDPGILTAMFGRVKGQTEKDHKEIHPFIPAQPWWKKPLIAPIDTVYQKLMTPTKPLGRILTELAMSKGEPLQGKDIQMEGTVMPNTAFRRVAGL